MDHYFKYKIDNIPVIYEDAWLLIVDKPSGLLTIPTPKGESRTLSSILNQDLKNRGVSYRLHPCHRLDRETSGLIIYAKGKSMQKKMMQEFKNKNIKKMYIAFIQGIPAKINAKIKTRIEGLSALTEYKIIEKRNNFSIAQVSPVTGRRNQIRIHFKQIGHPVVGETRYAFRRDFKIRAKRLCLHAQSLDFIHPINKKRVQLDCGLPEDLRKFLNIH